MGPPPSAAGRGDNGSPAAAARRLTPNARGGRPSPTPTFGPEPVRPELSFRDRLVVEADSTRPGPVAAGPAQGLHNCRA